MVFWKSWVSNMIVHPGFRNPLLRSRENFILTLISKVINLLGNPRLADCWEGDDGHRLREVCVLWR